MYHLLLIGPDWDITTRFRRELVADACASGWRVSVVAGGDTAEGEAVFKPLGVQCYGVPIDRGGLNPWRDFQALQKIEQLCRKLRPSVALAFTVKPIVYGLVAARRAGVPARAALVAGLGYAFMEGGELKRRLVRTAAVRLYANALRDVQRVFFQNDDDRADFSRMGILRPQTPVTRVAGSGVDLERFRYTPLPEGAPTFVMVARLLRDKGVVEFVEAARVVRGRHPEARFILVGGRDDNPACVSEIELEKWRREGIVELVGRQADVRPFLAAAHVFVLPSYREGTPRSALEALAMGRPVLTCNSPGSREVVVEGVTGRLVPPRDIAALAEAITWFINNREQLPAMSRQARDCAERLFDVHAVNRTILTALTEDMAAARGRS